MLRNNMETDTMIENLRTMGGFFGIIDHVEGPDSTFVLKWNEDGTRLEVLDVNPDERVSDTYTILSASPGEQSSDVASLLDKWWGLRGRMDFAANNPGHPEDPYDRPDLIYFHQRLKGGDTV